MIRALPWIALLAACASLPSTDRDDVAADASSRLGREVAFAEDPAEKIEDMLADGALGADEAVRIAVCNNRRLHAILEELEIARARVWNAALLPNPVVDAELQFVEGGGGELLEITVAQSIVEAILMPMRRQVAEAHFEQVRAEVTAAVIDLAIEVRTTYRELQAQQDLVELNESAADATWLAFDAARRLREAGNIIELDLLTEQALHEETRVALARARARTSALREAMNVLLGLYGLHADRWAVSDHLPQPPALDVAPEELERRAIASSLDVESAHRALLAAGHASGLSRLEVLMHETAIGAKTEREPDGTWSGGPTVGITIPIFDFGQAVSHEAAARLRRSYDRYTDTAIRVRHATREAFVAATTAAENSRYLREVVLPLRTRITERTQRQFNAMQIGIFRLMDARRRELAAGRSYVQSLREHWVARTKLEAMLLGRMPQMRFGIDVGGGFAGAQMAVASDGGGHE